jgi:YbbR domain-containing protein
VRVQPPKGITANEQSVRVTVALQMVPAFASIPAPPRVINLGAGLTATVIDPTGQIVALNVNGPLAVLAQLRPTDISVTVDVAGLGPGRHRLPPRVFMPQTLQLESIVPDRVEVEIARGP